jgi:tetratricopeptide (TPR) repeat protein
VGPVTEQSEHLSNAQIENYGNRTSGAGPEAAQRDEHQRVNHQSTGDQSNDQSIDDQRVEAHLTDCPSCRNRVLDFHRSLFASPTFQPEPDRSKAGQPEYDALEHDSSLYGHLPSGYAPSGHLPLGQKPSDQRPADSSLGGAEPTDSALADSNFANSKYPAEPQVRTAPTPECPSDDALRQLAAGLTPGDAAPALAHHASTCDHCGPLLRTFTEDFSDDFSPEEQAALANLKSSSAEWQKATAREMLKRAIPSPPSPRPIFSWKWIMVPALPAVALIAVGIWYLQQRDTPEKVAKLEAQAFTEQRTTQMRIPYAGYAAFNQMRSGDNPSRSALPPSLNRAADKIAQHLQKEPDDPQWLMLSARLDLWDSNYKAALSSLERISDPQAIQSPEYLMTRAFALFQKSEAVKESQGYSEAVDLLDKALQKAPDDPVLLFNQAIACEKIHSYGCAESDWNRFLAVEKDPQWTAEARKHLDQIREKKTPAR